MPSIFKTSLRKLTSLSASFTDLVLGPTPPSEPDARGALKNKQKSATISQIIDFIVEQEAGKSQITEVFSFETEPLSSFIELLVQSGSNQLKSMAFLGVEKQNWRSKEKHLIYVVPGESMTELIFAAQELIKSQAIDILVIHELLLKGDGAQSRERVLNGVVRELTRLKRMVWGNDTQIVLVNPATSERKQILSELDIICSHQFCLHNEVEKDESKTGIRRF